MIIDKTNMQELRKLVKHVSVQDVNCSTNTHWCKKEEPPTKLIDELSEIFGNIKQLCLHSLRTNIMLHEDANFAKYIKAKTAFIIVLDSNISAANQKYRDVSHKNILVHTVKNKVESTYLTEGNVYEFNPRKLHGLMVYGKLNIAVVWV